MRRSRRLSAFLALLVPSAALVSADVRVGPLVGSHMVLQRGGAVRLSGFADPGETVTVELGDLEARAVA